MNKNELVHLHTLLVRVAEEYIEWEVATGDDFSAYHALGTTPMALRQSRADHEAATLVLARRLADVASDAAPEQALADAPAR